MHKGFKVAKVTVFLRFGDAYLAAAGDRGGDSVGIKVTEKVLGLDFAPEEQGSILCIVGVNPFYFKGSEGAIAHKHGLTKFAPKVLVWPVLLSGPPACPEAVDDFLVVNANFAVPSGGPGGADKGGELCPIGALPLPGKGPPQAAWRCHSYSAVPSLIGFPFLRATTDQAHLRSRLSLAKVPPETSV